MSVVNASQSTYGGRGRGRARGRPHNETQGTGRGRGNSTRHNDNQENDHERDQFIASFQLNILSSSAPVLVRNDIRKLGDNTYSARIIKEYFRNSNPHNINIRIVQIWKVHNVRDFAQFMQNNYDQVDNLMLWHGTSRSNLVSILQNNLQLPVSATHGHMFGSGIYFADRMSKSANYTDSSGPQVFLLCQVALGRKYRVSQAQNFTSAPAGYNAIKAVGKNVPDSKGEKKLGNYCKVPCGRTMAHPDYTVRTTSPLYYNEYIVFDQDRIRIKFIVHCERGGSTSSFFAQSTPSRTSPLPIGSGFGSATSSPYRGTRVTPTPRTVYSPSRPLSTNTNYNQSANRNSNCIIL